MGRDRRPPRGPPAPSRPTVDARAHPRAALILEMPRSTPCRAYSQDQRGGGSGGVGAARVGWAGPENPGCRRVCDARRVGLRSAGDVAPAGPQTHPVRRRRAQRRRQGLGRVPGPVGAHVPGRVRGRAAQPGPADPVRGPQRARRRAGRADVQRLARPRGAHARARRPAVHRRRSPSGRARSTCSASAGNGPLGALRPLGQRDPRAARGGGPREPQPGTADRQPPGPAPRGDALVQPQAGDGPRRRGGEVDRVARATLPGHHHHELPGHRPGLPGLEPRPRLAAAARHPRDLHGSRDPVRELHPPDHDSVGAARPRVSARSYAPDLRPGPEPLRVRGRDHAGRHREEERDHDDRLRAGGAARDGKQPRARRSTRVPRCASGRS